MTPSSVVKIKIVAKIHTVTNRKSKFKLNIFTKELIKIEQSELIKSVAK